jgi:glycosyltransferase involved in cell wall biosynthesis
MFDVIHFHPNEAMANKFVSPLLKMESKVNIKSKLIVSNNKKDGIKFSLSIHNLLTLPFAFFKLLKTIKTNSPKVVIAHNTTSAFLPLLAAKVCGVKHIIYFNHGVPYIGHFGITKMALKTLERINLRLSTEAISVSSDMVKLLNKISKKTISLINNGSACGITLSKNKTDKNKYRESLGFKDNDFLVAFIGRPEKRKGYHFSITVWEKFFANKAGFKFLLYGGNNEIKHLKSREINNIFFMGFENDINKVLTSIDCIILPSLHEGLSYVCLEATLAKCPIICTAVPGLRLIVKNNKNGIVVNRDYASYAKAIKSLQSRKLDAHAQEKFSKKIYKKYNRDDFSRAYIKFLRKRICSTNL